MESSCVWRYANAREGKFQFQLRQDTTATGISGNKIVGFYNSAFGAPPGSPSFLYDGITWKGLNDPEATNDQTYAQGIDGNNIVGYFENATGYHGFLFDGTNWLTLDEPNAQQISPKGTFATAISGNKVVGWYLDSGGGLHGFEAVIVPEPSGFVLGLLAVLALVANKGPLKRTSPHQL